MHSSQLVNQSGNLSVSQLGPEVTLWKLKKMAKNLSPHSNCLDWLRTLPLIDLFYKQTGIDRNFIQMCILYFHHDAWKFPNHCMPHPLSEWISNTSSHFIHLFWTADKLEQTALIALVHLKWSHSNRKHWEEGEICEKVAQQTGSSCEIVGWTQ